MGGGQGGNTIGGPQGGMQASQGGIGGSQGGMGGTQGTSGSFGGGGSYQQANQMASRLQQMAMEENGGRGRRSVEYQGQGGGREGNYHEDEYSGTQGGMKRQMHSQGGNNRGKKNRGGWNR